MNKFRIIFSLILCSIFYTKSFNQNFIDSIRILPSLPTINDSIYFATYSSKTFPGECTYISKYDSIKDNKIYISGKYDSDNKCIIINKANDTINIGLFSKGTYRIEYSFIDIYNVIPIEKFYINFTVMTPNFIDSIRILPSLPTIHDSIHFATYSSKQFSGDCTYILKYDSIKNNKIYISGKYGSNCKCLKPNKANDTINLGLFPKGTYNIEYSFIDTFNVIPIEKFYINFTVKDTIDGLNEINYQKKINVFPNPTNHLAIISYQLTINSKVSIKLYDITGREIATLVYEKQLPGKHEIDLNMSGFEDGSYFIKIRIGESVLMKRVVKV